MAFDGITVAALVHEMQDLVGGRISKIAQPESDELLLTIKTTTDNRKLLISASASLPFFALTNENKPSPLSAPTFCMTLRKHIAGGRISKIEQYGLERIVMLYVDHLNEMGDPCSKILILEMMGKYSNIIFCDDERMIIDSIKHIPAHVSSLREVLPGRPWFFPETLMKENPLTTDHYTIVSLFQGSSQPAPKCLVQAFAGISTAFTYDLAAEAGIDADIPASQLTMAEQDHYAEQFLLRMEDVKEGHFRCCIYYQFDEPKDFSTLATDIQDRTVRDFSSVSDMIFLFYHERSRYLRMNNKSANLRKNVHILLERAAKKCELQEKQLKDTEKRDDYRLYGELLSAYAYTLPVGEKKVTVENYYDGSTLQISVDPDLSIMDNAKKYFAKYNKAKRMAAATEEQLALTYQEMEHLGSIEVALEMAMDENDLKIIQKEMVDSGFMKKAVTTGKKGEKNPKAGKPFHYVTEDGYHIYVGRNNYQNEALTFDFANGNDMWFHTKGVPGSHVIVKTGGQELPDHIYEIAGAVAAYYSSAKDNDKVEIDYVERKAVKKTPGGAPGFVIYHTNYSLIAKPGLSQVSLCND